MILLRGESSENALALATCRTCRGRYHARWGGAWVATTGAWLHVRAVPPGARRERGDRA